MWDKLWGYINKIISLTRTTEKNTDDIAELNDKVTEDRRKDERRDEKMDFFTQAVQRIAIEHEQDRRNVEKDWEMQRLRLELLLSQATQRLPPGETLPDPEKEELRAIVERLTRENEALKREREEREQK